MKIFFIYTCIFQWKHTSASVFLCKHISLVIFYPLHLYDFFHVFGVSNLAIPESLLTSSTVILAENPCFSSKYTLQNSVYIAHSFQALPRWIVLFCNGFGLCSPTKFPHTHLCSQTFLYPNVLCLFLFRYTFCQGPERLALTFFRTVPYIMLLDLKQGTFPF